MLNTIMALCNRNPGGNRQRIVKILFSFLFIGASVSLLLFTLSNSAWTPFTRIALFQARKEKLVRMSNRSEMATAGNTPVSNTVVAKIIPTATLSSKRTAVQSRIPTPTVVVQQRITALPQKVAIYSGNSGLENKSSHSIPMHPKVVHIRRSKIYSRKRSEVKAIATPKRNSRETINITLPALPIPAPTPIQPSVTPVVTVTGVPIEGTVGSNAPDSVVMDATPTILKSYTKKP